MTLNVHNFLAYWERVKARYMRRYGMTAWYDRCDREGPLIWR